MSINKESFPRRVRWCVWTVLAVVLIFPLVSVHAEAVVEAWVQRYNGPGNGEDTAYAVAVDSSNNVIVTGYDVGSESSYDYTTIQYSSAGVPLWTNRYNGPGNSWDQARALAVDGSNNVIVTGRSDAGGYNHDYTTIQYSSAGVPLWTNRYNGTGNYSDIANAVVVDGGNNVIVTGFSDGSGSGSDYATVKYSNAGVPLWTNRYNGPGNGYDTAYALTVDGSNNVIVTGYVEVSGGSADYVTIKYSSAGVPLWINRYNGPGNDYDNAHDVAVDADNSVIVTGYSTGSGSSGDFTTIKYSSAGVPLWTNYYNGTGNGYDTAYAVAVDGSNHVIVTGLSAGSGSSDDCLTIKYSGAGVPLWTNRYNGPGNGADQAKAVAVDDSDNVIVTGPSAGSGSSDDYVTIKYSGAGVPLWTNRYNGPGNGYDTAYALAVDGGNSVIVTGRSTGSGGSYDYATVKYSSAGVPLLTIQGTATNTFVVSWPAQGEGWVLECTNLIDGAVVSWPSVPPPYQTNGTSLWVTVTNMPPGTNQFYRLRKL